MHPAPLQGPINVREEGLPLFLRKLNVWGAFMFGLTLVYEVAPRVFKDSQEELGFAVIWLVVYVGFALFFGMKGNEPTAKNFLDIGWQFVNPEADETKAAKLT